MLHYDMAEVLRTPGMYQVLDIHEPPFTDEDVEYVAPITGRVTVTNTGTMLLIRGPVHTVTEMECSRCLSEVRVPIDMMLEEDFDLKVVEDLPHHDKTPQVVEEEIGRVFDGKVLCLDVLVRQAALLASPQQPLCRETCPGIPVQEQELSEEDIYQNSPFRDLSKLLTE